MSILQAWLIVGVPALITVGAMFAGRSVVRARIGYVILAATVLFFLLVPGDGVSAAGLSLVAFVLVASGRGTYVDREASEHHHDRRRFTTTPSHA